MEITSSDTFSFRVQGDSVITWNFDEETLKERLSGLKKGENFLFGVLRDFPTIDKAEVVFRPSWVRSFPEDPSRIRIEKVILK